MDDMTLLIIGAALMFLGLCLIFFDLAIYNGTKKMFPQGEEGFDAVDLDSMSADERKQVARQKRMYMDAMNHKCRKWAIGIIAVGAIAVMSHVAFPGTNIKAEEPDLKPYEAHINLVAEAVNAYYDEHGSLPASVADLNKPELETSQGAKVVYSAHLSGVSIGVDLMTEEYLKELQANKEKQSNVQVNAYIYQRFFKIGSNSTILVEVDADAVISPGESESE